MPKRRWTPQRAPTSLSTVDSPLSGEHLDVETRVDQVPRVRVRVLGRFVEIPEGLGLSCLSPGRGDDEDEEAQEAEKAERSHTGAPNHRNVPNVPNVPNRPTTAPMLLNT